MNIPEPYIDVVGWVVQHRGCVFGGAVRDFIRGVKPNDLDVSIPSETVQSFYDKLEKEGFVEATVDMYTKGEISVHIEELCSVDNVKVELNVFPDFDVNALAWDGEILFDFGMSRTLLREFLKTSRTVYVFNLAMRSLRNV